MQIPEVVVLSAIIVTNMIFVISEIALLTASPSKLKRIAQDGNRGAKQALKLLENPNKMLSSVQVGITFMSMVLGLYGGNAMGDSLADFLSNIPHLSEFLGEKRNLVGTGLAIVGITYITVLSEIVPKRIAMLYPETITMWIAHFISLFIIIIYPFVNLLTKSVQLTLKIMGIKEMSQMVSIEEIRSIIKQAETSGALQRRDSSMLQRLMDTSHILVNSVMTPRKEVVFLDISDDTANNVAKIQKKQLSSFPVIDRNFSHVIGVAPVKSLWNAKITPEKLRGVAKKHPPLYVPETAKVNSIIETFTVKKAKIAIVVDEYGDFEGILTLHDILKAFLGDTSLLISQHPHLEGGDRGDLQHSGSEGRGASAPQPEQKICTVSGTALMTDIIEVFNRPSLLNLNQNKRHRTVASFMLNHFGGMPKANDSFSVDELEFKVLKVSGFRIEQAAIIDHHSDSSEKEED